MRALFATGERTENGELEKTARGKIHPKTLRGLRLFKKKTKTEDEKVFQITPKDVSVKAKNPSRGIVPRGGTGFFLGWEG